MKKSDFLELEDIVGQYVQLTQEGKSHYKGQCPFCLSADSLVLSLENQYWGCLSCGVQGDRYDFVAKSENIGRAQAILLVGHHTNTGEPFPHARYKPGEISFKVAETTEQESKVPPSTETKPSEASRPATPEPEVSQAKADANVSPPPKGGDEQGLLAHVLGFRNIIPSYQGAAILDHESRMIVCDNEFPLSADLAEIGGILASIQEQAGALLSKWGMTATMPSTLTLASEDSAILMHKSGSADKLKILVVRLANPSDVPVVRRLVASAAAKFP
ncbi:MAG TPA: CHC2 zinc finger domain-containing protein [Gallionella sp.]